MVERPGLEEQETAFATYAHERRDERPLAGLVTVRTGNCAVVTHCTCGLTLNEPLIGQVVLKTLDLPADCTNRTLTPRHSDPLPKLKATALAAQRQTNGITGTHRLHTSVPSPRTPRSREWSTEAGVGVEFIDGDMGH